MNKMGMFFTSDQQNYLFVSQICVRLTKRTLVYCSKVVLVYMVYM